MRKLIFIIAVTSLSSCGIFKRTSKDILKESSETKLEVKRDSLGIILDKSTIVIKESADSTVVTKKEVVTNEAFFNMDSLVNGLTSISNDLVEVKQTLDTNTKKLKTVVTIKPRSFNFHVDKTTTINKDVTQQSKVKEAVLVTEHKTSRKVAVKKEPAKMGIWLVGLIVIVLALVGVVMFLVKKFKLF